MSLPNLNPLLIAVIIPSCQDGSNPPRGDAGFIRIIRTDTAKKKAIIRNVLDKII
jgi:hypothetical protein